MDVLIYGSREFGEVVRSLVDDTRHSFRGFIDDVHTGPDVLGNWNECIAQHSPTDTGVIIAVGYKDLDARWNVYQRVRAAGFCVPQLVHPQAWVAPTASIADGVILMARSVVDCGADLDELSVLWPGAVVNHNSAIGRNAFLSPNSTVCGCCQVGRDTFIGAGAVVADHTQVPDRSFVKAASIYTGSSGFRGTP